MTAPLFPADSPCVQHIHPSPNVEARRDGLVPDILLLHYTGMPSAERAIYWLAATESKVSCHYVIDEAGVVTQMVPEALRAWHAGVSCWHGCQDINSCSIGIEIHNPGHDGGYPPFPPQQMDAVIKLSQDITSRHSIRPERVLAHSDVAPARKRDPGEKFDWALLFQAGIGHYGAPAPLENGPTLELGSQGQDVAALQMLFQKYGYHLETTGVFDKPMHDVVTAFQRHFRPVRVDGKADVSTRKTLQDLLAKLS